MLSNTRIKGATHHPVIRVKKQNNVVKRQMDNYISLVNKKCQDQTKKLEKSLKNLHRQLEERQSMIDKRAGNQRATSGYMVSRYVQTPGTAHSPFRNRKAICSCDAKHASSKGDVEQRCLYFPCHHPTSYHTIGFRLDPSNTKWLPWKHVRKNLSTDTLSAFGTSTILNMGTSRLSVEKRLDLLQQEMVHRRQRMIANRPPAWQTNYGKPMPYKIMNCPVKLDPLD